MSKAMSDARSDLIARLEAAEAGSRELDIALGQALGLIDADLIYTSPDGTRSGRGNCDPWRSWTTSLDAALGLAARLCPEMVWSAHPGCPGVTMGFHVPRAFGNGEQWGTAATPALALCIALLKAIPAPSHSLAGDEGDSRSEHNDR